LKIFKLQNSKKQKAHGKANNNACNNDNFACLLKMGYGNYC